MTAGSLNHENFFEYRTMQSSDRFLLEWQWLGCAGVLNLFSCGGRFVALGIRRLGAYQAKADPLHSLLKTGRSARRRK